MEQTWCGPVEDFLRRLRTTGPNEHPVVGVSARRALLRTLTLWGTWYTEPGESTAALVRSHNVKIATL